MRAQVVIPIIASILILGTLAMIPSIYANQVYGDGLVQYCLDNPEEAGCLEIICHENPSDFRCNVIALPDDRVTFDREYIVALFCEQNPKFCPFEDPFPIPIPVPDPCLVDGCPWPWLVLYYGTLVEQVQFAELGDKITVLQTDIDTLKIDTVPLPEDRINIAIVLAGIAAIGSITAAGFAVRRR